MNKKYKADKWVAMVVMDHKRKKPTRATHVQANTIRSIQHIQGKASQYAQKIERESAMDVNMYKRICLTRPFSPKFYGLPKIHKKDTPINP